MALIFKCGEGVASSATTTYGYDQNNIRVKLVTASTTNIIPFPTYSTENGTAVKYISANGQLIATLRGTGTSTVAYYTHPDHLGSQDKTTDSDADIAELSDSFPYLGVRQSAGSLDDRKGALGKDYDADTGLSQFEARYYNGTVGRFVSQDPMFWKLPPELLSDPQQLNSYSYGRNNPIVFSDPSGKYIEWGSRATSYFRPGTHTYTRIGVTDATRPLINFSALGIPADTNEFTIGFYNTGSGYLESEIYYAGRGDDVSVAAQDLNGSGSKGSYRVTGQTPEEEAAAINMMGGAAADFNDRSFSYPSIFGLGVNSNSGNRTLAEMAGLGGQFKNFQPSGIMAGRGYMLPPSSFSSAQYQQMANIAAQIAALQKQLDGLLAQQKGTQGGGVAPPAKGKK